MKRTKYLLLILIVYLFGISNVYATGSASISVSKSKIENGSSVTATVSVNNTAAWNISISSSGSTGGCTQKFVGDSGTGNDTSKSFSVTCKSTSTGTINFVMSGDITSSDGTNSKISGSKAVTVTVPREKSTNNKLKSLSVEGYDISPSFDKNINEYSVTVPSTIESIKINAEKADSYSKIDGIGDKTVEQGTNSFEIVVTSETGVSNTYKINVNVEDQNPIEVEINKIKYTVVKEAKNLTKPELFDETTIKIGEFEIPAFKNEASNYTLVGLKDKDGKISLFIYKNGKYTPFKEFLSNRLSIIFLKMKKEPIDSKKTSIKIEEEKVEVFRLNSDRRLILYGLNLETGKNNYYSYDIKEKTLQLFNIDNYENSINEITQNKYLIYLLSGCLLFMFIIIILLISKSKKQNKLLKLKSDK